MLDVPVEKDLPKRQILKRESERLTSCGETSKEQMWPLLHHLLQEVTMLGRKYRKKVQSFTVRLAALAFLNFYFSFIAYLVFGNACSVPVGSRSSTAAARENQESASGATTNRQRATNEIAPTSADQQTVGNQGSASGAATNRQRVTNEIAPASADQQTVGTRYDGTY